RSQLVDGVGSGEAETAARAVLRVRGHRQLVVIDREAAGGRAGVHQGAGGEEREVEYWRGAEEHATGLLVVISPIVFVGAGEL
ncbi:hypothetical protein PENTCL1PPCAC_25012, partial [Pristionchus entomophagus]